MLQCAVQGAIPWRVRIPPGNAGSIGPWAFCLRDRVAQTAALPVLTPMVEADLAPEQYAYRSGRGAHDAVQRAHRLASTGHCEVVDADWSDDFGQRPHAELLKCVARRVGDGRMVGWVKAWWKRAVEEDDGRGGTRRKPGASAEEGDPTRGAHLSAAEQPEPPRESRRLPLVESTGGQGR